MTAARRAVVWACTWPICVVASVFLLVGRLGFNPTDEGLILSYGYRILHGQVPHRDFISPRPVGSSILHLVDLILPGPVLLESRLIALAELMGTAILVGVLVIRRPPSRWRLAEVVLVNIAFLIDLHTFPLMAWYTIDGLFLIALGAVLISSGQDRQSRIREMLGIGCMGLALTTKQSFFLAPLLAVTMSCWPYRSEGRRIARRLSWTIAIAATPAVLYVAAIVVLGGGSEMRLQLLHAGPVDFLSGWRVTSANYALIGGDAVGILLLVLARHLDSGLAKALTIVASAGVLVSLGVEVVSSRFALAIAWGTPLLWALLVYVAVDSVDRRCLDGVGTLVVAMGWMASLSWGYATPDLIAGACFLVLTHRIWTRQVAPHLAATDHARFKLLGVVAGLSLVVAGVLWSDHVRSNQIYRDLSRPRLTNSLGSVASDLGGLETNPTTAAYLSDLTKCVRSHPAERVAVLPENPVMYLVLNLTNPFPIDWMNRKDYVGSSGRLVRAAQALDKTGDYLVLFQTLPAETLDKYSLSEYEGLVARTRKLVRSPLPYSFPPLQQVRAALHGDPFACGTFVAVYDVTGEGLNRLLPGAAVQTSRKRSERPG